MQSGRAVAALLVVLFHSSHSFFSLDKYWGVKPFGGIFEFGHAGVQFFFVLSGFIILHVHWADLGKPERLASFCWKRFRRIYPVYWLALLLILPVYYADPALGKGTETALRTIVSSVTLVHFGTDQNVLDVAWSLYHEVLFYALFAVAILHARLGVWLLIIWFAVSAACAVAGLSDFPLRFYASPFNVLFPIGMTAAWLLRRQWVVAPGLVAVGGALLFLGAGLEEVYHPTLTPYVRNIVFGVGSASAILGLAQLERAGMLKAPRVLEFLGEASYSIYLTHVPALSLFVKVFIFVGGRECLPARASFVMLVVLVTSVGLIFHAFVETPLLRGLGRKRRFGQPAPQIRHAHQHAALLSLVPAKPPAPRKSS